MQMEGRGSPKALLFPEELIWATAALSTCQDLVQETKAGWTDLPGAAASPASEIPDFKELGGA